MSMNKIVLFIVFTFLSFTLLTPISAAESGGIKIKGVTGTVRVYTQLKETITLYKGQKPAEVAFGPKIRVITGKADVMSEGVLLRMVFGQAVTISKDSRTGAVTFIAGDESTSPIKAFCGSIALLINNGGGISVILNELGERVIDVVEPGVKIITSTGEEVLEVGQSFNIDITAKEKQKSGIDIIPEPQQPKIEEASPSRPK